MDTQEKKLTPEQQQVWDILNSNTKEARERRMIAGVIAGMTRVLSRPK